MKNRFAFVYMPSQREADSAIRGLNRAFGGESATRLRVHFFLCNFGFKMLN